MGPDPADIAALAERYLAAWNAHDPEAVARCFAEGGGTMVNDGAPITGRAEIGALVSAFVADFPDLRISLDAFRVAGPRAVFVWTLDGTHAASGRAVRLQGWEAWEVSGDGHLAGVRGYYDEADYARQLAGSG